jgi:hypothetical protein
MAKLLGKCVATCNESCDVCDAHCETCTAKCSDCAGATCWAPALTYTESWQPVTHNAAYHGASWGLDNLELVWYGAPAMSMNADCCAACQAECCSECCSECGIGVSLLDCLSPLCGIASDLGDAAKFCEGMQCSEEVPLEPGEPAEVLLEIRNRVGISPLTGTAYQPIDSTTCAKAQNTFVSEVRESAEMCVATDDDAELNALFNPPASECTAATSSVAAHSVSVQNGSVPKADAPSADMIPLLRLVSRNLEDAANALEESEMYFRADQLRELANELRLEARTAGGSWSLEPLGGIQRRTAPSPQPDVARENEDLRAELERLQESLRASHETPGVKAR